MDPIVLIVTSAIVAAFAAFVTRTVLIKKCEKDCNLKIAAAEKAALEKGYLDGVYTEKQDWTAKARAAEAAGTPWAGIVLPALPEYPEAEYNPDWDPPAY